MKIRKATRLYEEWLSGHVEVRADDVTLKHERMSQSPFMFLRASFYRWARRFMELSPEFAGAPVVLAVGDLHVENFGTWRDAEGRLVWGVNDFDEAAHMPYINDLVRLAVSAHISIAEQGTKLGAGHVCESILSGYAQALEIGGRPFVLDEEHRWLYALAHNELRAPEHFWKKFDALGFTDPKELPKSVIARLKRALPDPDLPFQVGHRVAGLGSLGRPRYVALAEWRGARIARETKPLCPSAWRFAADDPEAQDEELRYREIVDNAVRSPDPCLAIEDGWVVRRLSPSCSRIELSDLPGRRDELHLLRAMGQETANIHLGTAGARKAIRRDLEARKGHWLHQSVERMVEAIGEDWRAWAAHVAEEAAAAQAKAHARPPSKAEAKALAKAEAKAKAKAHEKSNGQPPAAAKEPEPDSTPPVVS